MSRVLAASRWAWDFVVGDDWRVAAAVVAALIVTALVAGADVASWWLIPAAVAAILAASVLSVARRR